MKKKNSFLKMLTICGSLVLLSVINICVFSVNDGKVKQLLTGDVKADAQMIGPYNIIGWAVEYMENHVIKSYKYDVMYTSCNPVVLSDGQINVGSTKDQKLQLGLETSIDYDRTISGLKVHANGDVNYDCSISGYNTNSYTYCLMISLPGDNWKVKNCESCSANDPDVIIGGCENYDACAVTMKGRIPVYKMAFGVD